MAAHCPLPVSQYCPAGQVTPAQGVGKHPATQRPLKQVSRSAQRTPAQGSRRGTQRAPQVSAPQTLAGVSQGSRAQRPPTQRCPRGQKRSSGHAVPTTTGTSTTGMSKVMRGMSRGCTSKTRVTSGGPSVAPASRVRAGPTTDCKSLHAARVNTRRVRNAERIGGLPPGRGVAGTTILRSPARRLFDDARHVRSLYAPLRGAALRASSGRDPRPAPLSAYRVFAAEARRGRRGGTPRRSPRVRRLTVVARREAGLVSPHDLDERLAAEGHR